MKRSERWWPAACVRCRRWLSLGLALLLSLPAQAQVWGFLDENGVPRFASEKLDDRYELFFRGTEQPAGASSPVASAATAPPLLHAFFEVSTRYKAIRPLMREAARAHGVEYELLKAVIATESGFDPRAVSPKGAVGLMQLLPSTAMDMGVKPGQNQSVAQRLTDPRTNLQAGARYLALLLRRFDGQTDLALAAYNAGEGAVMRAGGRVPNFRETRNYVRTVTQLQQYLQAPRAVLVQRQPPRVMSGGAVGRGTLPPSHPGSSLP